MGPSCIPRATAMPSYWLHPPVIPRTPASTMEKGKALNQLVANKGCFPIQEARIWPRCEYLGTFRYTVKLCKTMFNNSAYAAPKSSTVKRSPPPTSSKTIKNQPPSWKESISLTKRKIRSVSVPDVAGCQLQWELSTTTNPQHQHARYHACQVSGRCLDVQAIASKFQPTSAAFFGNTRSIVHFSVFLGSF